MTAWHPISTAPKDGTWVLLCTWDRKIGFGSRDETGLDGIVAGGYDVFNQAPTHWMPLPDPPEDVA